jgi:hypothetical protein
MNATRPTGLGEPELNGKLAYSGTDPPDYQDNKDG